MNAAIYVRISESDQSSFSIDAQLDACRDYATRQGWQVVVEFVEPGRSAETANRPQFQRMIAAARARQFGVIVVHKFDRFARSREDSVIYKGLLRRECSVQVVSVMEPIPDDGPMGDLIEGVLEVVAEWYRRNLAQEVAKGMDRMASTGLWPTRPPIGYERAQDGTKVLMPCQPWAGWITEAFREFATGAYTLRQWRQEADNRGMTEKSGRKLYIGRWSTILNNRIYLGEIPWRGEVYPGLHQPLTDPETFDAVQAALSTNNNRLDRSRATVARRREYLLSPVLYSLDVDCPMHGASAKGGKYLYYVSREALQDGSRHRVPCQTLDGQAAAALASVSIDKGAIAGLQLPDRVKFGLRVADSVGSVLEGLSDTRTMINLVCSAVERVDVSGQAIVGVKVRPPFSRGVRLTKARLAGLEPATY